MTYNKPCKFCGLPLTVESGPDSDPYWDKVFLDILACNRCADYRVKMGRLTRSARSVCLNLIQVINSDALDDKHREDIRKVLDTITRGISQAVCRFYNVSPAIWDQDFVEQLYEKPEKSHSIISVYVTMIKRMAAQQKPVLANT